MTKSAFDKIAAGLEDAIAYAKGDETRGQVATIDVKAVRKKTGFSQAVFAKTFRLRTGTVQDWEQGRRQPDSGSLTLLKMIEVDPKGVQTIIEKVRA